MAWSLTHPLGALNLYLAGLVSDRAVGARRAAFTRCVDRACSRTLCGLGQSSSQRGGLRARHPAVGGVVWG